MKRRFLVLICLSLIFSIYVPSQVVDVSERNARWREFNKNNFDKVNFSRTRLTRARLSKLKEDDTADDFALLRGVIFGKRGRIFKERSIQDYLEKQPWYKPSSSFSNAVLTPIERANLDLVRITEAAKHDFVEPGDMRIWRAKLMTEDKLTGLSILELRILREEFYARRGKKFNEPGIRDYFNWRDWYKPAKNQKTIKLTAIEQKNVDLLAAYEARLREKLSTELVTEETLGYLFAEDLRVLRNEIYARRGRIFKDVNLQKYFESQAWYKPNPEFKDEMLNDIEVKNLAVIREVESVALSKFSEAEG